MDGQLVNAHAYLLNLYYLYYSNQKTHLYHCMVNKILHKNNAFSLSLLLLCSAFRVLVVAGVGTITICSPGSTGWRGKRGVGVGKGG